MKFKHFSTMTSVVGLVGVVGIMPTTAFAQADTNDVGVTSEIVVTAQRRAEKLVDVPITVATLSSEALQTANISELSDIGKLTPGLRFDFAGGFFQPTIRGVGTAVATSGGGSNVGIYIDGFYSPNPLASNFQLMKLQNIQVLKGPQGTLFGRNTTGGAILLQTAEPSTTTEADFKASYGRYNEAKAQGYATFGLGENVAMDIEGLYTRGDGWRTNISNGKRVGDYEDWSVRLGMKAELSDNLSVLLRYQHADTNDPSPLLTASYRDTGPVAHQPFIITSGAPWYAAPGEVTFNPNEIASGANPNDVEFFRSKSDVVQLTVKADMGFADLTSYSQYRKENVDSSIEGDYSGAGFIQLGLPNGNETWSQELLVTSKPGSRLQWTLGAFYFSNRDSYYPLRFDYFPALGIVGRNNSVTFGSSSTTQSVAAFADVTYEVTPKLFVTGGLRYAHDWESKVFSIPFSTLSRYNATPADYAGVRKDHITPRVVIRYKPTDQSSIYASYTKGYKAGILDLGSGFAVPVKPESIDAFEVGFKYDNRRLSFESAAFYYDYKNLQISRYEVSVAHIVNAANSEIYGLDAQLRYDVTDHFQINLAGAWVHGRYKKFDNAPIYTPCTSFAPSDPRNCIGLNSSVLAINPFAVFLNTTPVVLTTLTNVTMQRTPEFTGNVGAVYKTDLAGGELALSGNLSYTSKFFFGPSGIQFPQKGYESLSLRAQWTDPTDRFTVAVWGDNVTNNRHLTQVQYAEAGIGANWNKPVTYGLELGVKFR